MVKLGGGREKVLSENQTSCSCSHSGANPQLDVQPDLTMQAMPHLRDVGEKSFYFLFTLQSYITKFPNSFKTQCAK